MVAAYHLIWTAYRWWLPNDPRGSNSERVCSDVIAELGELHHGRKKVQPSARLIRQFYGEAQAVLRFELRTFTETEIELLGQAFEQVSESRRYTCYACAIMPDHVHMLVRRHRDQAEDMIDHFQAAGRHAILDRELREPAHPVWGGPGWKVFLETREDIERTVRYIEQNPVKAYRHPKHGRTSIPTMAGYQAAVYIDCPLLRWSNSLGGFATASLASISSIIPLQSSIPFARMAAGNDVLLDRKFVVIRLGCEDHSGGKGIRHAKTAARLFGGAWLGRS